MKNMIIIKSLIFVVFFSYAVPSVLAADNMANNINKYKHNTAIEKVGKQDHHSSLTITNGWARASIGSGSNSAAYMQINNNTTQQIIIIGANASQVSDNVELHKSFVDEQGISRMTDIDKIVVPANSRISLKPGQIHIMLFDLRKRLKKGDKFFLTLLIQDQKAIKTEIIVK